MNPEKLRGWLNLPDGPWPPDYYALAGLAPGDGTAGELEARLLERLELLRRYQLPHPDEATEGMNLLARALDTLTDPEARRAYDAKIGVKPRTRVEPPSLPGDDVLNTLFPGIPLLPAAAEGSAPDTILADEPRGDEGILPDEILLPDVDDDPDLDDDPEFIDDGGSRDLPEAVLLPVVPPLPAMAKLADDAPPRLVPLSPTREVYAELARVRKVLRVWERARPYLADTERTFTRRTDSVALMGCLAELRPLLPTVTDLIGQPNKPGGIVAALARQRLGFDTFRSLLPSQREALAKDFRAAHYRLSGYYDDLRDEVRRRTEKGFGRRVWAPTVRHLINYPEWALIPIGMVLLAVAAVRSV
jgi:hypothetical protein